MNKTNVITVLILDDNVIDRKYLQRLLEEPVHSLVTKVHTASNKIEAEAILSEHSPAVAFIDNQLGDDTGIALIEKWNSQFKKTRFVLLTGCGNEQVIASALRLGTIDYISKDNLNLSTIQSCLSRLINKLWESQQLQSIMQASKAGIMTFDDNGCILLANQAMEYLLLFPQNDFLQTNVAQWFCTEDNSDVIDFLQLIIQFSKLTEHRYLPALGKKADGSRIPVEISVTSVELLGNEIFIAIIQDVSIRKALESLRDQQAAAIQATSDMVAFTDIDMNLSYLNLPGAKLAGIEPIFSPSNINISDFFAEESKQLFLTSIHAHLQRMSKWHGELSIFNPVINETIPVSVVITAIKSYSGPVSSYAFIMRDISETKLYQKALLRLTEQDSLTRLANKNKFLKEADNRLNSTEYANEELVVVHVNISHFAEIVNSYGFKASEEVIKSVAFRLVENCKHTDLICRCEGEKYFVLMSVTKPESLMNLELSLINLLKSLECPVMFQDEKIEFQCAIGVAQLSRQSMNIELAMNNAMSAANHVIDEKKSRVRAYDEQLESQLLAYTGFRKKLSELVANNAVKSSFSGIYNNSGNLVGLLGEFALALDSEMGALSYSEIYEAAEHTGIFRQLVLQLAGNTLLTMDKLRKNHNDLKQIILPMPIKLFLDLDFIAEFMKHVENINLANMEVIVLLNNINELLMKNQTAFHHAAKILDDKNISIMLDLVELDRVPVGIFTNTNIVYIKIKHSFTSSTDTLRSETMNMDLVSLLSEKLNLTLLLSGVDDSNKIPKFDKVKKVFFLGDIIHTTSDPASEQSAENANNIQLAS